MWRLRNKRKPNIGKIVDISKEEKNRFYFLVCIPRTKCRDVCRERTTFRLFLNRPWNIRIIHVAERHAKLERFSPFFLGYIPCVQDTENLRIFNPLRDARFHLTERNDYPYSGGNVCRAKGEDSQTYPCIRISGRKIFSATSFLLTFLILFFSFFGISVPS